MKKDMLEELNNIYEQLIDNGVVFHYGSESIPYGEITSLEFIEEHTVIVEIGEYEKYEIEIEDFIENHTKTGVNYHSWGIARRFDNLFVEL